MQSRLTLLASRGGRGAAPRRQTFLFQDRQHKTGIYTSRTTRSSTTKTAVHPSISHVRSFHRASPPHLLAPPSSALASASYVDNDDDDYYEYDMRQLEQDIERFSVSSFSQVLPEEIFYKPEDIIAPDGLKKYLGSEDRLSQELGMDSIWDSSTLEEGDDQDEDDFLVEEEDYSQDRQQQPHRPMDNATISDETVTSRPPKEGKKSALEILRNFNVDDQPPSTADLEEYQLWLECAAQREAVLKYQKALDSARNRKDYDSMSFMQKHLVQWYQSLRDTIQARQQEYLSNLDTRTAKNVYGPLLCSLTPEKMAVIASHEAMAHALTQGGINGRNGVPLVSMARAIGEAVETEVITQHRLRERFRSPNNSRSNKASEMQEDGESSSENDNGEEPSHDGGSDQSTKDGTVDKWVFSAGHLKQFMEILKQGDPTFKKNKQSLKLKLRKAQRAVNSSESWSNDDLVHLGVVLLSMLFETAVVRQPNGVDQPAFSLEKRWTKKFKTMSFVMLDAQVSKLFLEDEFVSLAATTTRHTPMILPPTDWVSPDEGGYRWLKVDLMRCHGSHTQLEALKHANLTEVYDGLNALGRTAWKVNQKILDVGQYCWKNNIPIGDIPSRDDFAVPDEPTRPPRIAPEVYADKESPEYKTAIAANKAYREGIYRSRKNYQKNMVCSVEMLLLPLIVV
jgi:DNA-directed RNA polymerase N-terminal